MDFRPLYRPDRHLFAIGFNLAQGRLDNACYDLLASECVPDQLPGRRAGRGPAPPLVPARPAVHPRGRADRPDLVGRHDVRVPDAPAAACAACPARCWTEACRTAVARQIEYGRQLGVPWGISESAFAAQYPDGDYQYQAFGVPGLGLKQGLEQDRVVAPYATVVAAMVAPREALENLRRLAQEGAEGAYGFYEAIDYTPDRVPEGERAVVVRSYMAHHQGMSLVALANALLDDVMPRRFHAEPMVRAVELLLQERVPSDPPIVETDRGQGAGSTSRRRRRNGADRLAPDEPAADVAGHARPADAPALELAVPRHGHQRRVGLQHLPGPRRDPLARGPDARGLGPVLLHPRRAARPRLVGRLSAGLPAARRVRGHLRGRQGDHSAAATATSRPCWR